METFPRIQVDEGDQRNQVVFGGQRATSFIKDVVAGKSVDGHRYSFNDELVREIHNRVSMAPGVTGFLRQTDSTTVGREPVRAHWQNLENMMWLYGRWFEEQMVELKANPDNLLLALVVAAAAHYGLTAPNFHPFDNGNGRTARALMNIVLMSQSYELTAHGLAVPPIPIIRTDKDSGRYIRSLQAVGETGMLNPFMSFIARMWVESLDERFAKIHDIIKHPQAPADKILIQILRKRRERLASFTRSGVHINGKNHDYQNPPI